MIIDDYVEKINDWANRAWTEKYISSKSKTKSDDQDLNKLSSMNF